MLSLGMIVAAFLTFVSWLGGHKLSNNIKVSIIDCHAVWTYSKLTVIVIIHCGRNLNIRQIFDK